MGMRAWRVALAPVAMVALVAPAGCGSDDDGGSPGPPSAARVVSARVYQGGQWVVNGETPATIGAALAKLRPTYVGSLLRFQAGEEVAAREIRAWNSIREAVRRSSPDAKFSVELNGLEYETPGDVTEMMGKVRDAVDLDGWLFDFYTPAAKRRPEVMEAAVQDAHDNGEFLGGNAFGISKDPPIPDGTDYVAVQDTDFRIDLDAVRVLARRAPVFFHLNNAPEIAASGGCRFINDLDDAERRAYVSLRARQQRSYDFRFAYPVFFPECEGKGEGVYAYNAVKDPPIMRTIASLLDRYD